MNLSQQYPGEMLPVRVIPLTQGQCTIVDPEDYAAVSQQKWFGKQLTTWYALRQVREYGKKKTRSMHAFLTGYALTDHVHGDGLDNRRVSLREATPIQNSWNRRISRNNSSGYIGVHWDKHSPKMGCERQCKRQTAPPWQL